MQELWVLILEKAVAKFCGDYHALDGGLVTWAFELMTGDTVHHFDRERNGLSPFLLGFLGFSSFCAVWSMPTRLLDHSVADKKLPGP
eukprot:2058126-Rhodomonas_salina.1